MSIALAAYRRLTWALGPIAGPYLAARARAGKEDTERLPERFGHASAARPNGTLVWLHGASVGEMRVAMLVRAALEERREGLSFLLTTGTRTSAALAARAAMARTIHQFAPIDRVAAVARFLDHWRPDVAIFAESDLWPNLVTEARRRSVRLALVNGRMSPESLAGWSRTPTMATRVLNAFDVVLAADARTAEGLGELGNRPVPALANLKIAAPAPAIDEASRAALVGAIGARPVWLAASTHEGEDEIALDAHAELRRTHPDALLIVVPRHPQRGEAVAARVRDACGRAAPRRSQGNLPSTDAPVYVADTMGEMGTLFSAAPVALVAGSLLPHLKGHNPIEPIRCGAALLSGPFVESFSDVFAELEDAGALMIVRTPQEIAGAVAGIWREPVRRTALVAAGQAALTRGGDALDATLAAIMPLLPSGRAMTHAGA
jgi:3-deoxy-D-manno-octulosonic-acid transferase